MAPFIGTAIFTLGTYISSKTGYYFAFGASILMLILAIYLMRKSVVRNPKI
ncbi:MAG: hypothetical protein HYZ42_11350 [Bacteroidetes bacterium]|nr:hypothetical protein [Bacteroidota bacterium]